MAARRGRHRRAPRLRPRRAAGPLGRLLRLRPPGGHHRRLRADPQPRAPGVRGGRCPHAADHAHPRRPGPQHRRPDHPRRGAFRRDEQCRRARAADAHRHPGRRQTRTAAGSRPDARRLRLDPRRHDHPDRHATQPDRLRFPRRGRHGVLRHVRLHPGRPRRRRRRGRLHRAGRLAAGAGPGTLRRGRLRHRFLPHRRTRQRRQQGDRQDDPGDRPGPRRNRRADRRPGPRQLPRRHASSRPTPAGRRYPGDRSGTRIARHRPDQRRPQAGR